MSRKFEYSIFTFGYFVISKQKNTKEQAIEIFRRELGLDAPCLIAVGSAFARYRHVIIDDGWPAWPDNCELIKVG